MWAFGQHLRVASAETQLTTCDSGVAAIFRRPCRAGSRDTHLVMADVEYIGQLQEIAEVNYGGLCVIVLLCKWIKANYRGHNATMKKDRWGFNLANFCNHSLLDRSLLHFQCMWSKFSSQMHEKIRVGRLYCEEKSEVVECMATLVPLKMEGFFMWVKM